MEYSLTKEQLFLFFVLFPSLIPKTLAFHCFSLTWINSHGLCIVVSTTRCDTFPDFGWWSSDSSGTNKSKLCFFFFFKFILLMCYFIVVGLIVRLCWSRKRKLLQSLVSLFGLGLSQVNGICCNCYFCKHGLLLLEQLFYRFPAKIGKVALRCIICRINLMFWLHLLDVWFIYLWYRVN